MRKITYSNQAKKFLRSSSEAQRILDKIEALRENPYSQATRVFGFKEKLYRIRVGSNRVLYSVITEEIGVIKIDKRSRVY